MTKRVIRQADLPTWFELSKYESANELTLHGWYTNLVDRYLAKSGPPLLRPGIAKMVLEKIILDPLFKSRKKTVEDEFSKLPEDTPLQTATVESMSTQAVAGRFSEMYWFKRPVVKAMIEHALTDPSTFDDPSADYWSDIEQDEPYDLLMADRDLDNGGLYALQVQLRAPDDQIKADFSAWLEEARISFGEPAPSEAFGKSDMEKWVTFAVLPYLDLELWAESVDARLPYALMGKVLFPNAYDYDPTERVRRTTKPYANRLTQRSVVTALWVQLAL